MTCTMQQAVRPALDGSCPILPHSLPSYPSFDHCRHHESKEISFKGNCGCPALVVLCPLNSWHLTGTGRTDRPAIRMDATMDVSPMSDA